MFGKKCRSSKKSLVWPSLVVTSVFSAWSPFPVVPINLCSSSETRCGSTEAAVLQSNFWLKWLISDDRPTPGPVSGVAVAALPARRHQHRYWWSNQTGPPRPTRTLTLSRQHLRHTRKAWCRLEVPSKILVMTLASGCNAPTFSIIHLCFMQLRCRDGSSDLQWSSTPSAGVFGLNIELWHSASVVGILTRTTAGLRGAARHSPPDRMYSSYVKQPGSKLVLLNNSTGIVPRLVAMLLWLLSDRKILGLCFDEFPPSESCWPDTAPCMDQDSAAGPDPVRVPAAEAERGWVGRSSVAVASQAFTLPGHTAVWEVQTDEGRSTLQDLGYTRTQSHDHQQTHLFWTTSPWHHSRNLKMTPTLGHILRVGVDVIKML